MNDGTIKFGRAQGQTFQQASTEDLNWYIGQLEKGLNNPDKAKYRDDNVQQIAEMRQIIAERTGGAAPTQGATSTGASPPKTTTTTATVEVIDNKALAPYRGSYRRADQINELFRKATEVGILLSPQTSVGKLPEGFSVAFDIVRYDSRDARQGGELYSPATGRYALTKSALQRISIAGALDWDPELCSRIDNRDPPTYCCVRSVATYKSFDGSEHRIPKRRDSDYTEGGADYIQLVADKTKPDKDGNPVFDQVEFDKQLRHFRRFILPITESKSMNRVMRAALGMKDAYTRDEIFFPDNTARPFIVAKLMFTGETDDPVLRQQFAIMQGMVALAGKKVLFGLIQPQSLMPVATPSHYPTSLADDENMADEDDPPSDRAPGYSPPTPSAAAPAQPPATAQDPERPDPVQAPAAKPSATPPSEQGQQQPLPGAK